MLKIHVTGSHWVNGSGWSYTEDLDPMEVDSLEEVKEAAKQYAAEFARNYGELGESEDYQLRFYTPEDEAQQNPLAKIWLSEAIKVHWSDVELVDGEGATLTKPQAIEALQEFKTTGGIHQVFVQYNGRDIDDPKQIDWAGFPVDKTGNENVLEMTDDELNARIIGKPYSREFADQFNWDAAYPIVSEGKIIAIHDAAWPEESGYGNKPIVNDEYVDADAEDVTED